MELALVENLQREGLVPLDEARGYSALVDLGLSQRQIAERVGCSQSHVSKRLALLELPAHVQARVTKGTLPLEAAAALVRLVGHPDKLKAAAGENASNIAYAVERAEKIIAWEAKRDELLAIAQTKGWPVVDEPRSPWEKHPFKTLATWGYQGPELELDVKRHEAESCHAVMIPTGAPTTHNFSAPSATSICTEPARHGPKGASSLKAKVEPKPAKREPDEFQVRQAQEKLDRQEAAEARATVIKKALAGFSAKNRLTPEMAMILQGVVNMSIDMDSDVDLATELLGLEPDNVTDELYAVEVFAAAGPTQLQRAALSLTLAGVEGDLRNAWSSFAGRRIAEHYEYLATLGYQPSAWEQRKLDEAAKAAADSGVIT